jgi:hypothetical protein
MELSPCSEAYTQLVKHFPAFCGTGKFITRITNPIPELFMNRTDPVRKFHSSLLPNGSQLKVRVLPRLPVHNDNSTHLIVQDLIIIATVVSRIITLSS